MAFVFRAERNFKSSSTEDNELGPGEYNVSSSFTKTEPDPFKASLRIPFNSTSPRDTLDLNKKDETPAPGTYEKITPSPLIGTDKIIKASKKSEHTHDSNLDFYKAIENNTLPEMYLNSVRKNKISFNTRSPRFDLKGPLSPFNDSPGPGRYDVPTFTSSLTKASRTSKIKFRDSPTTKTENRISTIPDKDVFGYDFSSGVPRIITDPDKSFKTSGVGKDTVGPGRYELSPSWNKNIVRWSKMNQISRNPTFNTSDTLTKSRTSLSNSFEDTAKNPRGMGHINPNISSKDNLFLIQANKRYETFLKVKDNQHAKSNFIFDSQPGPGYYTQDMNKGTFVTNSPTKKQMFGVTAPRFVENKRINRNVGPGLYYNLNKPREKQKHNLKQIHLKSLTSDQPCALELALQKRDTQNEIGPGTYDVKNEYIHEKVSNNNTFGSKEKRFKPMTKSDNFPGPGAYIDSDEFKFSNELAEEIKREMAKEKNVPIKKLAVEHFQPPPVGTYNPSVVQSINYKVKSNVNVFQDNKKVSFSSQDKRFKYNNKKELVGPGYYNERQKMIKENLYPFNLAKERFNYKPKGFPNLGPGSYESESLNDWNIKSHNILFI